MSRLYRPPSTLASVQTLICRPMHAGHHRCMDNDTLAALRQTAQHRLHFVEWIASRLEEPEDSIDIRREAAAILRQLVEDARAE